MAPATVTARRLGSTAHLVNNRISLDPAGQAVLDGAAVTHHAVPYHNGRLGHAPAHYQRTDADLITEAQP
jgi:hypothetical protein